MRYLVLRFLLVASLTVGVGAQIVAIGDLHGDIGALRESLRDAGLVDAKDRWKGGKATLVQIGDMVDRGPDSRKVMDLLMQLEKQAAKAGGRVHVILGNHDAMNLYGDLRYVSPGEYAAFRTKDSADVRDAYWAQLTDGRQPAATAEERAKWDETHPLGWVEHRFAFGPKGKYGKWLQEKPAVVKVGDTLFVHAGLSAKYAGMGAEELNAAVKAELADVTAMKPETSVAMDVEGPFWYRGWATGDEAAVEALVTQALATHGAKRAVIGHTPTGGEVTARFGGRVVNIDVGLGAAYGSKRGCLVIEGERLTVARGGQRVAVAGGR